MSAESPTVLWWSRSGRDYSRDRVMRRAFAALGWRIVDYKPWTSGWGAREPGVLILPAANLVWVPCFRQKDAAAARRWSERRGTPAICDPLISAYDKQVFERRKFSPHSRPAQRLLRWEARLLQSFELVIADTQLHAEFFHDTLGVDAQRIAVIPVGAEEAIFQPQPPAPRSASDPLRVLFYGSFIGLQGPEIIAAAARSVPEVEWTLLGDGPLRDECRRIVGDAPQVRFVDPVPYAELPHWIGAADVLLGVFGATLKAGRVIPNKVYQALACGRPVVTQWSAAYPAVVQAASFSESGLQFISPGSADALAAAIQHLAERRDQLRSASDAARKTFELEFSESRIQAALTSALAQALA